MRENKEGGNKFKDIQNVKEKMIKKTEAMG